MRLGIVCDYPEERWHSMNLVADRLIETLIREHASTTLPELLCPGFKKRLSAVFGLGKSRLAFNADRLLNRFLDYPSFLRGRLDAFDFFHVCDHSYAQLLHELPAPRTGVVCHDLDAFRCLWESGSKTSTPLHRWMARRTLSGLRKAALVFHDCWAIRREIEERGLVDPERLVYAPPGVSAEFSPKPDALDGCESLLAPLQGAPYLLHVGSCIPRKRIDVLLEIAAALRERHPELRLVQVGGVFSKEQRVRISELKLQPMVTQFSLPRGSEKVMAGLYRRALSVLLPSEYEGFGFVVLEALACGRPIVATDLPVLREVGGEAAVYCPLAQTPRWIETVERLLSNPSSAPPLAQRLAQARRFSWEAQAAIILSAYETLR